MAALFKMIDREYRKFARRRFKFMDFVMALFSPPYIIVNVELPKGIIVRKGTKVLTLLSTLGNAALFHPKHP